MLHVFENHLLHMHALHIFREYIEQNVSYCDILKIASYSNVSQPKKISIWLVSYGSGKGLMS